MLPVGGHTSLHVQTLCRYGLHLCHVVLVELDCLSGVSVRPVEYHVCMVVRFPFVLQSVPYGCTLVLVGVDLKRVYSETLLQSVRQFPELTYGRVFLDYDNSLPDWGCLLLQSLPGCCFVLLCDVLMYFRNGAFHPLLVAVGQFWTDVVQFLAA